LHLKHLRECSSTFRSRWEGPLIRNRGVVQGGLLAHVPLKHFADNRFHRALQNCQTGPTSKQALK
jgi:hypothetical protein